MVEYTDSESDIEFIINKVFESSNKLITINEMCINEYTKKANIKKIKNALLRIYNPTNEINKMKALLIIENNFSETKTYDYISNSDNAYKRYMIRHIEKMLGEVSIMDFQYSKNIPKVLKVKK